MDRIALIFPGQGAQFPGMGRELYDASEEVRALYTAAETIRPGITDLCFSGTPEDLKQTANTQPALYLTELAAATALRAAGVKADAAAGFSLGEITALAAANAFTAEEGFRIVCQRGALMGRPVGTETAMAAVLKLDSETVEKICAAHAGLYPVNYNCPGQITVSGEKAALDAAKADFAAAGGRVVPLAVSGAFHSPFMREAAEEFGRYLSGRTVTMPEIPVYANRSAEPYRDPVPTMEQQICHPVLWEKTIRRMAADGITVFIEAGPGQTLTKFVQRTAPDCRTFHAATPEEIEAIAKEFAVC